MGVNSLSKKFGWSKEHAQEMIDIYFDKVPFLKETRNNVVKTGKARGYLKTILGRRARVSPKMMLNRKEFSLFNRLVQGSAADILKKSMVDSYEAGVYNVLYPHITVHDEMDFSIPRTKEGKEAVKELKNIMENCIKIRVPLKAEFEIGENWGNLSEKEGLKFLE
jgi:DNA polymerase-1